MSNGPKRDSVIGGGLVCVTALAILLGGGGAQSAVLALAGGVGALLFASGRGPTRRFVAPPAVAEDPGTGEAILDGITDPVLVLREGIVLRANEAARQLLGTHIVGEDARTAIRHPAAAERLASPGGNDAAELIGLGGRARHWEMRVTDRPPLRTVHLTDRTAARAAERMRVDFVANASHELRTPLAAIIGYVETLRDDAAGGDPGTRGRFLEVVFDEATRMERLVSDLISLSRIEAEKFRPPVDQIDLPALVRSAAHELARSPRGRQREIVTDFAPDLPHVLGDSPQIAQVIHNLIGNAFKYGRAGTPVTVRLAQEAPGMVTLAVIDEGEGIAGEHIPRLTERFYRVDSGRSRALGGTGLGLAIVKHIVERHRGRLSIGSEVGRGTTVCVTLPAATVTKT